MNKILTIFTFAEHTTWPGDIALHVENPDETLGVEHLIHVGTREQLIAGARRLVASDSAFRRRTGRALLSYLDA